MMTWLVCEDVPDEYVPMLMEEMELDGPRRPPGRAGRRPGRPRRPSRWWSSAAASRVCWPASGCRRPASPSPSSRRTPASGGTWWENTYPGARVDVGNHFYCYSFEPSDHWTEYFAQQPELQRLLRVGHGQARRSTPTSAGRPRCSAPAGTTTSPPGRCGPGAADGTEDVLVARAVISRGRPAQPAPPARASPARTPSPGPSFHSARWDHSRRPGRQAGGHDRGRGQRVPDRPGHRPRGRHLTVFQRTAQWMFPNPNYHDSVGPGVRWALRHLPFYGRWYRFLIFWPGCDKGLDAARVGPRLPRPAAGGQRDERVHPADVHRLDHQPGR